MRPFICLTCGSLCVYDLTEATVMIFHPTNIVCASRTNLQSGVLRVRRYLELSARVLVRGDPEVSVT